MEDRKIVQLYWDRMPEAIPATSEKYGGFCARIARNILESREDAEECVNDTYLRAWNSMPPHRPEALAAFLGKITRNLSFNRYRYDHAGKRGGGQIPAVLDELAEVVSDTHDVEREIDRRELIRAVNAFLDSLPREKRRLFVRRYWYSESIAAIARELHMTENHVSVTLNRLRGKLRGYLEKEGFEL